MIENGARPDDNGGRDARGDDQIELSGLRTDRAAVPTAELLDDDRIELVHPLTHTLEHDHGHWDAETGVPHGEGFAQGGSRRGVTIADEGEDDQSVVEGAGKLPLRPRFVRLLLDHEEFNHPGEN